MAYGFGTTLGSSTGDCIEAGIVGYPSQVSFHCWSWRNADTTLARIFGNGLVTSAGDNLSIINSNSEAAGTYSLFVNSGPDGKWRWTNPSSGVWTSIGVSFDLTAAGNVPVVYQNGVLQSLSTVAAYSGIWSSGVSTHSWRFGNRGDFGRNFDGMIAEGAVWDGLLSSADFIALSDRLSALRVRPDIARGYSPIVRSIQDYIVSTGTADIENGNPQVQPQPPIIYARRRTDSKFIAGAIPEVEILSPWSIGAHIKRNVRVSAY